MTKQSTEQTIPTFKASTKLGKLVSLMQRRKGATVQELAEATGWQVHSVRGTVSGTLRKKRGLEVKVSIVKKRGLVCRIDKAAALVIGHG